MGNGEQGTGNGERGNRIKGEGVKGENESGQGRKNYRLSGSVEGMRDRVSSRNPIPGTRRRDAGLIQQLDMIL